MHGRSPQVVPAWINNGILVFALLVSVCMNIAYSHRLRALNPGPQTGPQRGAPLQPQVVRTNDGPIDLVNSPLGGPTIIYYFSPTCGWCERSWLNVAALERDTRDRYRFVAVSAADHMQSTIQTHRLEFDVHGGLSEADRRALGFAGTPQTIVVSPEGRVVSAWAGAYTAQVRREIEEFFGVVLPGLSAQMNDTGGPRRSTISGSRNRAPAARRTSQYG